MSIKVHYFPGYGRAEAWRLLLSHAKLPYENVLYAFEVMSEAKASGNLEFGQLPVLEMDGKFSVSLGQFSDSSANSTGTILLML